MKLKEFNFINFKLNVIDNEDGKIFFYGIEVAKYLGYKLPHKAIQDFILDVDKQTIKYNDFKSLDNFKNINVSQINDLKEIKKYLWSNENDKSDKILISECGFYELCFKSKLEKAVKFRYWVSHQVLPSIRQKGYYILNETQKENNNLKLQIEVLENTIKELREKQHKYKVEESNNSDINNLIASICNMK